MQKKFQNLKIPKFENLNSNAFGYTIVEVLIVVIIMAILFTVGYGNYRGYQRRQYLEGAVRQTISDLRLTQEFALAGRKPDNPVGNACETGTLQSYRFIWLSTSSYQIEAACDLGSVLVKGPVSLPPDVEMPFFGAGVVTFRILGNGVETTMPITITLQWPSGGVASRQVTITPGGNIR